MILPWWHLRSPSVSHSCATEVLPTLVIAFMPPQCRVVCILLPCELSSSRQPLFIQRRRVSDPGTCLKTENMPEHVSVFPFIWRQQKELHLHCFGQPDAHPDRTRISGAMGYQEMCEIGHGHLLLGPYWSLEQWGNGPRKSSETIKALEAVGTPEMPTHARRLSSAVPTEVLCWSFSQTYSADPPRAGSSKCPPVSPQYLF